MIVNCSSSGKRNKSLDYGCGDKEEKMVSVDILEIQLTLEQCGILGCLNSIQSKI